MQQCWPDVWLRSRLLLRNTTQTWQLWASSMRLYRTSLSVAVCSVFMCSSCSTFPHRSAISLSRRCCRRCCVLCILFRWIWRNFPRPERCTQQHRSEHNLLRSKVSSCRSLFFSLSFVASPFRASCPTIKVESRESCEKWNTPRRAGESAWGEFNIVLFHRNDQLKSAAAWCTKLN